MDVEGVNLGEAVRGVYNGWLAHLAIGLGGWKLPLRDNMQTLSPSKLAKIVALAAALLVLKVTLSVMLGYRNYFPPNFNSEFLHGRESYFYDSYRWAFYAHLVSGPLSLVLGLILLSESVRQRFPKWHRTLGKVQIAIVLCLLTPSGLWMARDAQAGTIAAVGFSMLALLTGMCVWFGWRCAVRKRFAEHRRWMLRTFVLLCSAVVIRLVGGLATVMSFGPRWFDPLNAWGSWLVPLAILELSQQAFKRTWPSGRAVKSYSSSAASASSLPDAEIAARSGASDFSP
jgi:hypothetical protein